MVVVLGTVNMRIEGGTVPHTDTAMAARRHVTGKSVSWFRGGGAEVAFITAPLVAIEGCHVFTHLETHETNLMIALRRRKPASQHRREHQLHHNG